MVDHGLEALSAVGAGEIVLFENFDAPLHHGVNGALVGELPRVSEAHTKSCVSFILLCCVVVRVLKLGRLYVDRLEGDDVRARTAVVY